MSLGRRLRNFIFCRMIPLGIQISLNRSMKNLLTMVTREGFSSLACHIVQIYPDYQNSPIDIKIPFIS
ncbi:hypothetical protein GIB67_027226 [Kingdonia uniflora]|uniref:Uncharacterized protein n=1 Tax=Kingdonia uniflora TaxID=39325 RepID=A0A7J7KYG4_9MAGN|nr:hypothetical protein GIB67_027226 [Kingdonia uniflora]